MTYHIIDKIPQNYRERIAQQCAVSDYGFELFDQLIAEQLPKEVLWTGDELIAPIDWEGELDLDEIIGRAADKILASDDSRIWVE